MAGTTCLFSLFCKNILLIGSKEEKRAETRFSPAGRIKRVFILRAGVAAKICLKRRTNAHGLCCGVQFAVTSVFEGGGGGSVFLL